MPEEDLSGGTTEVMLCRHVAGLRALADDMGMEALSAGSLEVSSTVLVSTDFEKLRSLAQHEKEVVAEKLTDFAADIISQEAWSRLQEVVPEFPQEIFDRLFDPFIWKVTNPAVETALSLMAKQVRLDNENNTFSSSSVEYQDILKEMAVEMMAAAKDAFKDAVDIFNNAEAIVGVMNDLKLDAKRLRGIVTTSVTLLARENEETEVEDAQLAESHSRWADILLSIRSQLGFNVTSKVKHFIANFQIALNIGFNCHVRFPANFEKILSALRLLNWDLIPSLGLDCALNVDFISRMVLVCVLPVALSILILLSYITSMLSERLTDRTLKRQYIFPQEEQGNMVNISNDLILIRRTFSTFDEDGCGKIKEENIKNVLTRVGRDPALSKVILSEIPLDEDGEIEFHRFCCYIIDKGIQSGIQSVHESSGGKRGKRMSVVLENSLLRQVALQLQERSRSQHLYLFLLLTFLVLVQTSTTIFQFFQCQDFPEVENGTESYLRRDYSVSCLSMRYKSMRVFAVIMIAVYPVGIPLLYFTLVHRHRDILRDEAMVEDEEANGNPTIGHIKFLFESCKFHRVFRRSAMYTYQC